MAESEPHGVQALTVTAERSNPARFECAAVTVWWRSVSGAGVVGNEPAGPGTQSCPVAPAFKVPLREAAFPAGEMVRPSGRVGRQVYRFRLISGFSLNIRRPGLPSIGGSFGG
jgi:hypothetical protein